MSNGEIKQIGTPAEKVKQLTAKPGRPAGVEVVGGKRQADQAGVEIVGRASKGVETITVRDESTQDQHVEITVHDKPLDEVES